MKRIVLAAVILTLPFAAQAARHRHPGGQALAGFSTLTAAKSACGAGPVAWRAHDSKVFHLPGSRYFGRTKRGAYVCEKAAEAKGLRAAKS